jgi:hypothetical protein
MRIFLAPLLPCFPCKTGCRSRNIEAVYEDFIVGIGACAAKTRASRQHARREDIWIHNTQALPMAQF